MSRQREFGYDPPETSKPIREGNIFDQTGVRAWASRWLTAKNGLLCARANGFSRTSYQHHDPADRLGPCRSAMPSRSENPPWFVSWLPKSGGRDGQDGAAAISGTTPPKTWWVSIWLKTKWDRTSRRSFITATPVLVTTCLNAKNIHGFILSLSCGWGKDAVAKGKSLI